MIENFSSHLPELLVHFRFPLNPLYHFLLSQQGNCSLRFLLSRLLLQLLLERRVLTAAQYAPDDINKEANTDADRPEYLERSDSCTDIPPDTQGYSGDDEEHGEPEHALSEGPEGGLGYQVEMSKGGSARGLGLGGRGGDPHQHLLVGGGGHGGGALVGGCAMLAGSMHGAPWAGRVGGVVVP